MANNEILQIVVFSMFFGVALAALGEKAQAADRRDRASSSHVMLKITGYVMKLAPLAVFAAMAATVTTNGLGILLTFGGLHGRLLPRRWSLLWGAAGRWPASSFLGPRVFALLALIREPFLLAFSTASSEAAYPKLLEALEPIRRAKRRSPSFVLPLGYSFNLDGSMMYCTFATLFIAQAYGIHAAARHSRSPCC